MLLLRDDWILRDASQSGPHLVELPFGPAILIFVAIGLISYGLYSFVRARRAPGRPARSARPAATRDGR